MILPCSSCAFGFHLVRNECSLFGILNYGQKEIICIPHGKFSADTSPIGGGVKPCEVVTIISSGMNHKFYHMNVDTTNILNGFYIEKLLKVNSGNIWHE